MAKQKTNIYSFFLALLSGGLLPLALAPFSWWPIALFSTCVLCFLCRGQTVGKVFALALVFGLGQYGVGTSWVYVSIHDYGHATVALAAQLTALFTLGMAIIFALPLSLFGLFRNAPPSASLLAFPALWVLGEWSRSWFLTGFPWLNIGYGFIDTWIAGWAPIAGVMALSGFVVFGGALSALLIEQTDNKRITWTGLAFTLLVCASGTLLSGLNWSRPSGQALNIALVQPDQPLLEKWHDDELKRILIDFQDTNAALYDQDLIIWPESALPTLQNNIAGFLDDIDANLKEEHVGVITGIPSSQGLQQYYNSVIGLGRASGRYQKRRLVPFGEYVPLEQWLRGTIDFFDLPMSTFSAGADRQTPISIGEVQIAPAICYEIAYPDLLARDAATANILLTVSNDTWFGNSIGPHQHFQMARMRALENAKPLLRATNDGITAVIDQRGKVSEQLPRFTPGILKAEVTPFSGSTPLNRYGSRPLVGFCFTILLLLLAVPRWQKQRG